MAAKKNTGRVRKEKMDQMMLKEMMKETYEKVQIHQMINFDIIAEKDVKVSIIIPVYNAEQNLRECLDSAVNQTLQEIEIICVNDGSTDGSLEILKEYAEHDSRVKVIDKENAGYGHTMNLGMDMACGEYIGIIESDDYVKIKMFETLYNIAALGNIDIVKADYYRFSAHGDHLRLFYHMLTDNDDLYNKIITDIDNFDTFIFTDMWCGIYKRSFLNINMIRHKATSEVSNQNNDFRPLTTVDAKSIYCLDKPLYMKRIVERTLENYKRTNEIDDISFEIKLRQDDVVSIVFICDKGYVIPTATAIASLVKFKDRNTIYDITIIAVNLLDEDIRNFSMIKALNISINIFYIEQNILSDLHYKDVTDHGVSTTALIKFLLPNFMGHCDKILYLDGDVIVKRDLLQLYCEDLEEYYAGVIRDIPQVLYERQIFGEKYGREYFNSGVMLLNVKKMRGNGIASLLIETKRNLDSKLMDQDVFNEVFKGKVKQLSIEYNTLYVNLIRSRGRYRLSDINDYYGTNYRRIEDIRGSSNIIHYCSEDKPWKYYDVPMADVWLEHYFRSQYGNKKLVRESSIKRQDGKGCNGEIQFREQEKGERIPIPLVFHYNCYNTKEIIDNISFIKAHLEEDEKCELYLLYEKKNILQKEWFENDLPINLKLSYIEISKILERDKEYISNGELHENYYRMLVPEILCQYDKVFIVDGAKIEKEIRYYFYNSDSEKIINYMHKYNCSFWDSPAMIIDVKKFIYNNTKFKYFDAYNKSRGIFDFSKSFFGVIPKSQIGRIDFPRKIFRRKK